MKSATGWVRGALIAAGFLLAAGCAPNPKYIAASTGSPGQVKFLYVKKDGEQGVIKCDRDDAGKLSACRRLPIVLVGE